MGFYAVARTTRDIDVVIEINKTELRKMLEDFSDFYFNAEAIEAEIKRGGMFNLIDTASGYKTDFIIRRNSEYAVQAFHRKKRLNAGHFFPYGD